MIYSERQATHSDGKWKGLVAIRSIGIELGKIREGSLISDDYPGYFRRGVTSEGIAGKQER